MASGEKCELYGDQCPSCGHGERAADNAGAEYPVNHDDCTPEMAKIRALTAERDALKAERDELSAKGNLLPIVVRIGDSYVALYPRSVLANGWQPYDQPDPRAYIPHAFEHCERNNVGAGAELIIYRGKDAEKLASAESARDLAVEKLGAATDRAESAEQALRALRDAVRSVLNNLETSDSVSVCLRSALAATKDDTR